MSYCFATIAGVFASAGAYSASSNAAWWFVAALVAAIAGAFVQLDEKK